MREEYSEEEINSQRLYEIIHLISPFNQYPTWTMWAVAQSIVFDNTIFAIAVDLIHSCENTKQAAAMLKEMLPKYTPDGALYTLYNIEYTLNLFEA